MQIIQPPISKRKSQTKSKPNKQSTRVQTNGNKPLLRPEIELHWKHLQQPYITWRQRVQTKWIYLKKKKSFWLDVVDDYKFSFYGQVSASREFQWQVKSCRRPATFRPSTIAISAFTITQSPSTCQPGASWSITTWRWVQRAKVLTHRHTTKYI